MITFTKKIIDISGLVIMPSLIEIQKCLIIFIASTSIATNEKYRDYMSQFINELIIATYLYIKDIDGLYKNVNDIIKRHINYQLNNKLRREIIVASQREDMTENEADIISRFNFSKLTDSVFHMCKYEIFQDVIKYMNLIPTFIGNTSRNKIISDLHLNIANILNIEIKQLHVKSKEESHKIFHQIIMTDEYLTLLSIGIEQKINIIIDKTYNSMIAYIADTQ
jgi:hypothetical protein